MPLTSIVGFDSAWTDLPKNPGAVCAIRIDAAGHRSFVEPQLASFTMALDFIDRQKTAGSRCLVALDQPTIVPNIAGLRPVDRSLLDFLAGRWSAACEPIQARYV
jgi:predicted RNase H-like nuclease